MAYGERPGNEARLEVASAFRSEGGEGVTGYLRILAAAPGFFLSSLFVMLFSRSIAPQLELEPVDYVFAMLITIALWVAAAPLVVRAGKGPAGRLFGKAFGAMMKGMMPKMMDGCFSKMDSGQRKGMLDMCHSMLARIEEKYFSEQDDRSDASDKEAS